MKFDSYDHSLFNEVSSSGSKNDINNILMVVDM